MPYFNIPFDTRDGEQVMHPSRTNTIEQFIREVETYEVNSSSVPGRLNPVVLLVLTRLMICGTFNTIHKTIVEMLAK